MGATTRDQTRYRGRDDDVGLNTATWNGGAAQNTGWTQDVDVKFRIRFVIDIGGMTDSSNVFELWFDHGKGAGMEVMTASTPLQHAATDQYANGDTTSQILGSGTYTTGDSFGGVDDATDTGNCGTLAIPEEFEVEWCLTIDSAQVADEDVFEVEVRLAGGTPITISQALTALTVNKVSVDPIPDRFVNNTQQAVRRAAFY